MSRDHQLYINDILVSISKIQKFVKGYSFKKFQDDEKTVDAVVRNLEIIGEAARNIPQTIRDKAPHVQWKEIIGMRNKISHEYFGVDLEILWTAICDELPTLKSDIKKLKSLK